MVNAPGVRRQRERDERQRRGSCGRTCSGGMSTMFSDSQSLNEGEMRGGAVKSWPRWTSRNECRSAATGLLHVA